MTFQPGQSGNPGGRPPKARALTAILAAAGDLAGPDGVAAKDTLAAALWAGALTGRIALAGTGKSRGKVLLIKAVDDWLALVRFLYAQVDGPPKAELELSGPDGVPVISIIVNPPPAPPEDADV